MPWTPWSLRKNPLSPAVPVEGSETVEGLRTLEQHRLAELLQVGARGGGGGGGGGGTGAAGGGWRRAFQRYRGPFIEQLGVDDLKQAPKSWAVFWKGSERGQAAEAYNLPASLAVLKERTEENFVTFLPNYMRLAGAVFLATFYLRPKALLGAAAVIFSMWRSAGLALQRQQAEATAAAATGAGGAADARGRRAAQQQQAQQAQQAQPPADPNEQAVTAGLTVITWILVAYTRCLPMLMLAAVTSLLSVLGHCALRRSPSEHRHKGRQLLGYTWRQVLGREPTIDGSNPRALFRQLGTATLDAASFWLRRSWIYTKFYAQNWVSRLRGGRVG